MASQVRRQLALTIGRNIKAARDAKGLTQRDLAEAIDTDSFSVSRWERGAHKPSDDALAALAAALEMPLSDFFTEVVA